MEDIGYLYAASAQRIKRHMTKDLSAQLTADSGGASYCKPTSNLFIVTFVEDSKAGSIESLKIVVSSILLVAHKHDKVVVKIKSHGGIIEAYGCAAMQLQRLKSASLSLTVSIDEVATSAAYLMAAISDRIIASPFASIGGIGMVSSEPNFSGLLAKMGVGFNTVSAGREKEGLTMFEPPKKQHIDKLERQLKDGHRMLSETISRYRPDVDIDKVCQGDVWFGEKAKTLGLVDELKVFDDFILEHIYDHRILSIRFSKSSSAKSQLYMKLINWMKPAFNQ